MQTNTKSALRKLNAAFFIIAGTLMLVTLGFTAVPSGYLLWLSARIFYLIGLIAFTIYVVLTLKE